ncbi:MAG: OmpA family protein [Gallionella sp.]|nr:OmpA family protein [Gallionella sp.]
MQNLIRNLVLFGVFASAPVLAEEDCSEAVRITQQAEGQAQLAHRLNEYTQARSLCPSDPRMHYREGLALMASARYAEAHSALMNAMEQATKQNLPPMMRLEVLGRLAENDYRSENRPKALIGFKVAREFAKKHQLSLPDWVVPLQKDLDQQLDKRPLTPTEMQASLRSMRDLGVEPTVDYRVLFEFNSDQPTEAGKQQLSQIAASLQADNGTIRVIGHTDVQGKKAYNQQLSERRAKRIVALLLGENPALQGHLQAQGKGMTQPKYPGNSEEDHQLNRRVEFVFAQ